ncbi:Uncharacterized protein AXF42_Ash008887 [Apostasia shenzhenica]|uniref:Probable zinc-ribbon domain-containing protein n=1 Tax=Apostasia shenzhenica TaxID=1088818 RepID=A0A2I0ASS9_9ASPA|nr:Uncharacterized protein AXF42_Ash008887 [Apostasia shenzhenica]
MPRVSSSQTARNVDDANCKDENKQEDGTQANASCGGVNISSGISSEANGLMNSRDKLEECSEAERDMISAETRNGNSFRFSARCSHAYDSSASSTNEGQGVPQKYLLLSRRTFRNKKFSNFVSSESENDLKNSVNAGEQPVDQKFSTNLSFERSASANAAKSSFRLGVRARGQNSSFASEDFHSVKNWMESEKGSSPRSATEDIKRLLKFRYSKQDDRAKILSKIDELRDDLNGYFNKTADRIRSSRFTVNVRNFEGKVPPAQYRSSLVPFSKQSISSCLHCHPGGTCCHNDHCRPCPHNICCHLPKPANQPLETVPSRRDESHNFKRHCRPVSGGSPFVICYRCFKLLQLPADFLVSTKKVHKLRCGDCSQILLYTFRPKIQSEPETPAEAIHPPSEVGKVEHDCCGFSGDGVMDPVSYSEEYGLSFGKSFSYEANNEIVEEEDEDGRVGRLHLHKLMGYSSARQLLY